MGRRLTEMSNEIDEMDEERVFEVFDVWKLAEEARDIFEPRKERNEQGDVPVTNSSPLSSYELAKLGNQSGIVEVKTPSLKCECSSNRRSILRNRRRL